MSDYASWYEGLTAIFRKHPRLITALRLVTRVLTYLMYAVYPLFLLSLLLRFSWGNELALTVIIPGAAFVILSLVRKKLNRPRPYEVWNIQPLLVKDTKGQSMPSRHTFSASLISGCVWIYYPRLGALLLVLSMLLALCRVLGGVHFPRDVIVGYLLGLVSASLLLIFA